MDCSVEDYIRLTTPKRNIKIYDAYRAGVTKAELARLFDLSAQRVSQIIEDVDFRINLYMEDDLYAALVKAYEPTMGGKCLVSHAYTVAHRMRILTAADLRDRCDKCHSDVCPFRGTEDAFLNIRNAGEKTRSLLFRAQQMLKTGEGA